LQGVLGKTEEEKGDMMKRWKEAMERAHEGEKMDNCLRWTKPMTSKQAAYYLMTKGFIAVELFDARIRELKKDNARLRKALVLAEEHIKVRLPKGDASTALVLLNITEALKEGEDG